jgi:aerobic carbon-monoxide dehydrogenase medium subunit
MYPAPFEYVVASTLDEAIEALTEHGDEAKVLAGGQSLIPLMKLRLAAPPVLVDIGRVGGLSSIEEPGDDGHCVIGALATESEVERSTTVRNCQAMLADASAVIADPLVRNRGTVGGNLAHADPANDHPAVMLACGAEIVVSGPRGDRVIPADDFFVDLFATSLAHDEIVTAIRVPATTADEGSSYVKLERQVGDFAIAGAAAWMRVEDGVVREARVGLTNAAATPVRATAAESLMTGRPADGSTAAEAAAAAADAVTASDSLRGSARYRRAMFQVVVEDALNKAISRVPSLSDASAAGASA